MSMLSSHIPFVKDQMDFHHNMVEKFKTSPYQQKRHLASEEKFKAILSDLETADKILDEAAARPPQQIPIAATAKLTITPADISGLPEELRKELSISETDPDFVILSLLDESGGVTSLDLLLIGLYKKTGEVHKRQALTSRLYRMRQKNLVFNVSGKTGYYASRVLTEDEINSLFGGDSIESDTKAS